MIDSGDLEYIGPCDCGRKELVVWKNKDHMKSSVKITCDGRLYRYRAPGQTHYVNWCRTKHYSPEELG